MMENQITTPQERAYSNEDGGFPVSTEKPSSLRMRLKSAIVIAIATLFAGGFGYSLVSLIIGEGDYRVILITSIVTGLLYMALVVLEAILLHDAFSPIVSGFLQSLALVAGLFILAKAIPSVLVIGSLFIMTILFALAEYTGRAELENTIKIRFGTVSGLVSKKSFLAIAVFIAVIYGFAADPSKVMSGSVTKLTTSTASVVVSYYIPGFKASMKMEEVLSALALQSINKTVGGMVSVKNLPESVKQKLVIDSAQAARQSLESSLGVKLDPEKTFSETVTEIVGGKIKDFTSKISQLYLSGIFAIVVFLTMMTFGFAVYWLVALIAFFIYQIFLVTGFATLIIETKSKETVVLE